MYPSQVLLYALSLSSFAYAAPRGQAGTPLQAGSSSYTCLHGTTFPAPSKWKSFSQLSVINQANLGQDSTNILKAIQSFTQSPRPDLNADQFQSLILAQVMQESGGAGNVVSDKGQSYGLLQVQLRNGETPATCDPSGCTYAVILKMLQQGVYGHSGTGSAIAPGIAFWLGQLEPGPALRSYNTGTVPDANDLSIATSISTPSYVSDVGNRLNGISPNSFPTKEWLQENCGFQPVSSA